MEEITLKELIEKQMKISPIGAMQCLNKLVELEAIENWLNTMYGIELEIKVKPAEKREGRFYGKGLTEMIAKEKFNNLT